MSRLRNNENDRIRRTTRPCLSVQVQSVFVYHRTVHFTLFGVLGDQVRIERKHGNGQVDGVGLDRADLSYRVRCDAKYISYLTV